MNTLTVIDVSAVVYTGNSAKFFADRKSFGFPVGGIHYLLRQLSTVLGSWDSAVLCFDSPSFRSKQNPDYKSGRVHHPEVYSQIELLYDALSACGVTCEKYDDYEADDIVHWTVDTCSKNFMETIIVGNDHDLCHDVRNGVRFKSIAPGSSCVHVGNFESAADSTYTKFNTISAKKTLCGCSSDHIPVFRLESGKSGTELYRMFLRFIEENGILASYENTTNWKLLGTFAKSSGLFTERDWGNLMNQIEMVYPADRPEDACIVPCTWSTIDHEKFFKFLTLVNDWDSLKCLGGKRVQLTDSDKQIVYDLVNKLKTGEYAADKNLEHVAQAEVKSFDLDIFEREF